ncbi:MAG: UDP-N-acetyl glucosamine 2-epimerase [Chitinophagaceae bacterium]
MKSIIHIVGNRPQFIKLAVLYRELAESGLFTQKIIHTGQHFSHNMSDLFFKELNLPDADINFDINNLKANQFIAKAADELEKYFINNSQCIAIVYGDTNTTLAAAIAAKRSNILLVHFESGVRTGEPAMTEEINRILTDRLADINLCCTASNYSTMQAEGYGSGINSKVYLTGDLMLDAFTSVKKNYKKIVPEDNYITFTIHRSGNVNNGDKLQEIITGLNEINDTFPVIFPVHPNTRNMIEKFGCNPAFKMLDPLGHADMISLLAGSDFVITDSGGTCREAYFLHKYALIVMERPFWPEIIENNCALSCAPDKGEIIKTFFALPGLKGNFETNIFGDGNAAKKIKEILADIQ